MMRFSWLAGAALIALPAAALAGWQDEPAPAPAEATVPLADIRIDIGDEEGDEEGEAAPAAQAPPAPATSAAPRTVLPTAEERLQIAAAGTRGRLLFDLARAAAVTTQDMLQRIPDPTAAGITGWVAEPAATGLTIIYYASGDDGLVAAYRANVVGGRIVSQEVFEGAQRPALSAAQRRMAAAREAAAGVERQPCGGAETFNVFVIPPASESAAIEVYKTSPQTQRGRFPLAGHFLVTVAPDGGVADTTDYNGRCADLTATPAAAGGRAAPVNVSHGGGTIPNELHAFLSLWMNRPLLVATAEPTRLWTVTQGRIALVGEAPRGTTGR